tara:strand:+ start:381 stop:1574 length:1194 start_codon:yes stop_codon:yes gene_type:complete
MINEIILHIGMHKTGSSSVQKFLHEYNFDEKSDCIYLKLPSSNHSSVMMTVFLNNPEKYHEHIFSGVSSVRLEGIKKNYESILDKALSDVSASRVVISAEDLSAPGVGIDTLERIRDKLLTYSKKIIVFGYVRDPVGYMQSAFQQRVKGAGLDTLNLLSLWPHYKSRFDSLDQVFGAENVKLFLFDKNKLQDRCVISDFCSKNNIKAEVESLNVNDSIGLDATSLIFCMNKYVPSEPNKFLSRERAILSELLVSKDDAKFTFSSEILSNVFKHFKEDLVWIERRIGETVYSPVYKESFDVSSENDLISTANRNAFKIKEVSNAKIPMSPICRIVSYVEELEAITSGFNSDYSIDYVNRFEIPTQCEDAENILTYLKLSYSMSDKMFSNLNKSIKLLH